MIGFAYKVRDLSYVLFVSFSVMHVVSVLNFGNKDLKLEPRNYTK
jgi:hypothetical protein